MFMIDLGGESHYTLLGVVPTATTAEIRAARDARVKELRERQRREPDRRGELMELQKVINAVGEVLARPARRAEYDLKNAHLRFFTIRTAAAPMFVDPMARVAVLHRAIVTHLRAAGVPVQPSSDLERTDFRGDETANALLDELLEAGQR
jgi:hypothetical protein